MTYPDTNPYTPGQHPPPKPKKTGRRIALVLAVITVMIFAVIGACTAAVDGALDVSSVPATAPATGTPKAPAPTTKGVPVESKVDKVIARDLKLTSCKIGDFDTLSVAVTITNKGNDTATYMVSGDVQNPAGERIGEWTVTTSALPPGKVAKSKGFGVIDEAVKASVKIRCNITEVTRF